MSQTQTNPQASSRESYERPELVRYGRLEELTHGANHITTNITDILSLQSSDRRLKQGIRAL